MKLYEIYEILLKSESSVPKDSPEFLNFKDSVPVNINRSWTIFDKNCELKADNGYQEFCDVKDESLSKKNRDEGDL